MIQGRKNRAFYADLAPFSTFDDFTAFDAYSPMPDDWVILAGDVIGSTRAIENGRYKAVNMIGAAVITSVLNAVDGADVPYVFGGDGGFVVVPPDSADAARDALRRLQTHAMAIFRLELRAVALPVSRIRAEGRDLLVRKLALSPGNNLAFFAGGGVELTDLIMKSEARDDLAMLYPDPAAAAPDLEGLSCRWEPLEAARDRMIALLVQPVGTTQAETFSRVNGAISDILRRDVPAHAPASNASMRFRWPPRGLFMELRSQSGGKLKPGAVAWGFFTALMQKICHLRGVKIGDYDGPRYLAEVQSQTDFRKFDGCLRMVLDCSENEVAAIRGMLDAEHASGSLAYGLHADRSALMTCLVFSLEQGRHMHFVDAAGGGFATAALDMKAQLKALRGAKDRSSQTTS